MLLLYINISVKPSWRLGSEYREQCIKWSTPRSTTGLPEFFQFNLWEKITQNGGYPNTQMRI